MQRIDQIARDQIMQNIGERMPVAVLHFRRRTTRHAMMVPRALRKLNRLITSDKALAFALFKTIMDLKNFDNRNETAQRDTDSDDYLLFMNITSYFTRPSKNAEGKVINSPECFISS